MTTHNTHNRQTYMRPVGFEPKISAGERPKTYALDRAACVKYHFLSESVSWPAVCTRVQCNVLLNTPNVGPYIYDVSISGFTRSSIYTGVPGGKCLTSGDCSLGQTIPTHTPQHPPLPPSTFLKRWSLTSNVTPTPTSDPDSPPRLTYPTIFSRLSTSIFTFLEAVEPNLQRHPYAKIKFGFDSSRYPP